MAEKAAENFQSDRYQHHRLSHSLRRERPIITDRFRPIAALCGGRLRLRLSSSRLTTAGELQPVVKSICE